MSLTVGAEGLTVQAAKDTMYTVLDRDLAAVLRWPDGSRTVWGHDGTRLLIDPSDWRKGEAVVAAIDERVPDELVVQAEPELVRTQDAVEHVASEKLKRRWVVDEELKMLPAALGPDEEVLTVAEANIGLRSGLLAATDRRLLWLYKMIKERQIEIEYADIRHVRAKRSFLTTNVVVETDTDRFSFEEIAPKGRATELEGIIRERLGLPAG